jgi:hypothetical protein
MTTVRDASPVFMTENVQATAEQYRDVFGFCVGNTVGDPPNFCMLFRDGATIVLARGEPQPNGKLVDGVADAFIGVVDVAELAAELEAKGADIVHHPVYRPAYDGWEMAVRDRDGRMLLFTQAD